LFRMRKLTLRIIRREIVKIILFAAVALLPVGWIFVTAGHSYENYWYTYKGFAISCFSLLSLGIYLGNLVCDKKT
ncbi:MAG: hypothetical protein K2H40_09340, partial [Lachnospiraceae bacterium]|nr:hypothetical protein [Lachnospiraceae bacterium]